MYNFRVKRTNIRETTKVSLLYFEKTKNQYFADKNGKLEMNQDFVKQE